MTLNILLFSFSLAGLAVFMATRFLKREGREERLARSDEKIREICSASLRRLISLRVFIWRKAKEFRPVIIRFGLAAFSFAVEKGKALWRKIKSRGAGEKRGSVSFYLKSVSEYKKDSDN